MVEMDNSFAIVMKDVAKDFKVLNRHEGLKGSVKDLHTSFFVDSEMNAALSGSLVKKLLCGILILWTVTRSRRCTLQDPHRPSGHGCWRG